jgi:hypothetical protein
MAADHHFGMSPDPNRAEGALERPALIQKAPSRAEGALERPALIQKRRAAPKARSSARL